jgi:putative FmdB family regulatory protein
VPIYEYRCSNGHTFELFQRMSDPSPEACQVCGVAGVEKILFPVAVHYKGSGFYSTDYGKGRKVSASKDGGGDGGSSDKKESSSGSGDSASSSSSSSESSKGSGSTSSSGSSD